MHSLTSSPTLQIAPSDRLSKAKPYFFKAQDDLIHQLTSQGKKILRFDVGSPDMPPADHIIEEMIKNLKQPDQHGYSPHGGGVHFREAASEYYYHRFNVSLHPLKETVAVIGTKEGLFHFAQAFINENDVVLVPDPAYPVYINSSLIAGAKIHTFPLLPENHFLPDLEALPKDVLERAKCIWLNYPNNPTGATASLEFFEKIVALCRKYGIFIIHDAAYNDVYFDKNDPPPSILQIPNAKDIAIELYSLSKTYNMAGWRIGMAVGNEQAIGLLSSYKSQADSSSFGAILNAAATALKSDQTWVMQRNSIYKKRRDEAINAFNECNLSFEIPKAAIYLWCKIPAGYQSSAEFCQKLLEATGICLTPGSVYGDYGEGYFRLSLAVKDELFYQGIKQIVEFIQK